MHANKDTVGQEKTRLRILERKIQIYKEKIQKFSRHLRIEVQSENVNPKKLVKFENSDVWTFSNKYHLFTHMGSQIRNNANFRLGDLIYTDRKQVPEFEDVRKEQIIEKSSYFSFSKSGLFSQTEVRIKNLASPDAFGRIIVAQNFGEPINAIIKEKPLGRLVRFVLTLM